MSKYRDMENPASLSNEAQIAPRIDVVVADGRISEGGVIDTINCDSPEFKEYVFDDSEYIFLSDGLMRIDTKKHHQMRADLAKANELIDVLVKALTDVGKLTYNTGYISNGWEYGIAVAALQKAKEYGYAVE